MTTIYWVLILTTQNKYTTAFLFRSDIERDAWIAHNYITSYRVFQYDIDTESSDLDIAEWYPPYDLNKVF